MKCGCIEKVNEQLASSNARVATRMFIDMKTGKEGEVMPVHLEKINAKNRKPLPALFPSYCVFCGEKRA